MLKLVLQSRLNSTLIFCLLSAASALLPIIFLLTGALLALVCYCRGIYDGLLMIIVSILVFILLDSFLNTIDLQLLLSIALLFWLPIIFTANAVKQQSSLKIIFIYLSVIALLYWIIIGAISDYNPTIFWQHFIQNEFIPILKSILQIDNKAIISIQDNIDLIAFHLSSTIISLAILFIFISLIIGRYWQAKLYNPNGFAKEFKNLQMGKLLASIGLVIVISSMLKFPLTQGLQQTFMLLFLFQGLSIGHSYATQKSLSTIMVVLFYLLLFIVTPLNFLISAIGVLDNWLNFRDKFITNHSIG